MQGQRLPDQPIGGISGGQEIVPGGYWRVLTRGGNPRPLNVLTHPEDRGYWGNADDVRWASNLTGHVYGIFTPNGLYGMLSIHTVREEEDGTISVRPGDGSSNSILVEGPFPPASTFADDEPVVQEMRSWHGYIEHGVWREC